MDPAKCEHFLSSPSLRLHSVEIFLYLFQKLLNSFGTNRIMDVSYLERALSLHSQIKWGDQARLQYNLELH